MSGRIAVRCRDCQDWHMVILGGQPELVIYKIEDTSDILQ